MSYLCGWCGKYLSTKIDHNQHIANQPHCLKRDGAISPVRYKQIQVIIGDLGQIGVAEKLDPDNELMLSEAISALNQIHL